jgi:hypothetical protein
MVRPLQIIVWEDFELTCALCWPYLFGRAALFCFRERNGGDNVNHHRREQADAGDPHAAAVQGGLQQVAVFIDGVLSGKDEQVADHVAEHEADQHEARQGHENLLADGGGVKSRKGVKNSAHVGRKFIMGIRYGVATGIQVFMHHRGGNVVLKLSFEASFLR